MAELIPGFGIGHAAARETREPGHGAHVLHPPESLCAQCAHDTGASTLVRGDVHSLMLALAMYTAVHFVAVTIDPKRAAAHNRFLSQGPIMAALLAAAAYTVVPSVPYALLAALLYIGGAGVLG